MPKVASKTSKQKLKAPKRFDVTITSNEDGSFKEYHASETTSTAREINMVTHYTVHPDDVDAGQVSLTAD